VAVGYADSTTFGWSGAVQGDWIGVPKKGVTDAIIVKYDGDGNIIWKGNFGGRANDQYTSVTTVSDGVVAVGYADSLTFRYGDWTGVTKKGNTDAIIVKYDQAGTVIWKKNFGGKGWYCVGYYLNF